MLPIKRIVAPVDFSESSVRAARAAMAWAARSGSELHLLHAIPDAVLDRTYAEFAQYSPSTLVDDWTRGTRDALDALAARLSASPGRLRTAVRLGQPAAEIAAYAAEQEAELIIMSSTGHGAVARLLLGSVAEKVVRDAGCPVLIIPGDVNVTRWSEHREGLVKSMTLRTIVVLTDFSDLSRHAMTYAHDVAAHLGAALHVLHVVPPSGDPQLAYVPPPAAQVEEARWRAERWLMRAVERFTDAHGIVTATRIGKPAVGAVAYADEVSADLMVLATHGRGAIDRLLLGSVAQNVLRRAHCPILTVNQTWCDATIASVPATSHETV